MEQLGYFSKNSLQHPPTEVAKVTKSEKGIAWWGGWGWREVDKMSRDESTRQCLRGRKGTGSGSIRTCSFSSVSLERLVCKELVSLGRKPHRWKAVQTAGSLWVGITLALRTRYW